jgi:hypothetical protein
VNSWSAHQGLSTLAERFWVLLTLGHLCSNCTVPCHSRLDLTESCPVHARWAPWTKKNLGKSPSRLLPLCSFAVPSPPIICPTNLSYLSSPNSGHCFLSKEELIWTPPQAKSHSDDGAHLVFPFSPWSQTCVQCLKTPTSLFPSLIVVYRAVQVSYQSLH